MRRRKFLGVFGGAAAWPFVARAQQGGGMRRVGILLAATADDSQFQTWVGAAKALGLEVPPMLLARADEVIE